MSDQKQNRLGPSYQKKLTIGNGQQNRNATLPEGQSKVLVASDGKDVGGWDAYRRWLTRVQTPAKRRVPLDPSIYTWKGYRNWSEKVRRDWKPDEQ
jgi:hypothetical protein